MPVIRSPVALASLLLCLLAPGGCAPPGDDRHSHASRALPDPAEVPAAGMPAPAEPPAAAAEPTQPVEAASQTLPLESLVLTPPDTPFAEQPAHHFGEVPDTDWLAAPLPRAAGSRVLPDLFGKSGSRDTLNVEGELLLDGSHGTSRMVDGVGMKIEVSTD